jgi:hypothetical protein
MELMAEKVDRRANIWSNKMSAQFYRIARQNIMTLVMSKIYEKFQKNSLPKNGVFWGRYPEVLVCILFSVESISVFQTI